MARIWDRYEIVDIKTQSSKICPKVNDFESLIALWDGMSKLRGSLSRRKG